MTHTLSVPRAVTARAENRSWNMLRHLGLIVVCACIVASVGCDGGSLPPTAPPSSDSNTRVTIEFGGRVVNFDKGGPVANVRVSLEGVAFSDGSAVGRSSGPRPDGWVFPTDTATSGGDGTFTLRLNLPSSWSNVRLELTGPAEYDDTGQWFYRNTAADRPAIKIYPTLVIKPGESIEVGVERGVVYCGWGVACRRVVVAASPGEPVELEIVPHDTSTRMGLAENEDDDTSVLRRLMVAPGSLPYIMGAGTATLTARR